MPPRHVVGVVAGGPERLDGERRAAAHPALEDDRRLLVDLLRAPREPLELDVHRAGDAPGLPLVGLAHVDELRLAALDELLHALRLEVELVVGERSHERARLATYQRTSCSSITP